MKTFSSADAKNHFGEFVDAARLEPVAVTKYDKPFVVMMSVEEFEKLRGRSSESANKKRPSKVGAAKNGK